MSGKSILSLGGALVGGLIGGLGGARIGFTLGAVASGFLFPTRGPGQEGPRLQNLETMTANEGAPLPIVYASVRVPGVAIWTNGLDETATTESAGGGKGASGGGSSTTYTYSASFAVSLCEGPITGVRRIWADTKLIYDRRDTAGVESILASNEKAEAIRIYLGDETQTADPLIAGIEGAANTPAFRNAAYIVFEDLQLADFGNRIPSISAEVVNGAATDPPIKIIDWTETQGGTIPLASLDYSDGLIRSASIIENSPTSTQNTWVIKTYDLNGNLLLTEQQIGNNINNGTNNSPSIFSGNVELGYMRQEAAGTGPTTMTWGAYGFGFEGLVLPAAPRPFSADGFLSDASFDYYRALGGGIVWDGTVYAENWGTSNEFGITTYPPGPGTLPFPSTRPAYFFAMDPYLGTSSSAQLKFHLGDDGYLYVTTGEPGFLDGSDVLRFDRELNLIDAFALEGGIGANEGIAVWNGILAKMEAEIALGPAGRAIIYDISDAQIGSSPYVAPIINSVQHDLAPGNTFLAYGIGGGLWVAQDGIWSMNPALAQGTTTLQAIVEDICERCDLAPGEIDATDLSPVVRGYIIDRPMPGRAAIEGLTPAYFFDGFESGVGVKFTLRGGSSVVTLTEDDVGAFVSTPPTGPITRSRQQELELPQQVDVLFMDSRQDYQVGGQRAQRIITTSVNQVQLQLAVVLTSTEAAQSADKYLQSVWAERDSWSFTLPPRYKYLEPADLITIPTATGNVLVRIVSITEGADNVLEIEAVSDLSRIYSSVAVGNDTEFEVEQSLSLKGPTKFSLIDVRQLRNVAADDSPGYYVAGRGYYTGWSGASIFRQDEGEDAALVQTIFNPVQCGTTTDILGSFFLNEIDVYSSVNVNLIGGGSLSSITESQLLAGGNAALIGSEIVYFRNVTAESDGSYTLDRFIRGVGATSTEGHLITDRFIMLDSATLRSVEGTLSDGDTTFLVYTFGAVSVEPTEEIATLENNRIRPVQPVHAFANRASGGDFEGQFVRQARSNFAWIDNIDVPLDETTEVYEVDVFEGGSPTTVLRTIDVDSTRVFTYTRDQQIADFGAVQETVEFAAYQISDRVNRGFPIYFTGGVPLAGWTSYDALVLADQAIALITLNSKFKLSGLADTTFPDFEIRDGTEGTEFDYTAASPFDENATVCEGLSAGDWTLGSVSNAAHLNQMDSEFSIEFLIKTDMTTSGTFSMLFYRGDIGNRGGSFSSWFTYLDTNARNEVRFSVAPNDGSGPEEFSTSGAAVNDGDWHHICCVFDNVSSPNKMYIYIDGLENATKDIAAPVGTAVYNPSTSSVRAEFGETPDFGGDFVFDGSVTRLALYDYALSPAQVTAHFNATGL